jgi:phosphohistidine phosphatase
MGKELKRLSIVPRTILCSAAVRTRETLRLALPDAEAQGATVLLEEGLYMASAEMLLARLRRLAGDATPVLLIGHNPSLQNLALALAGSGQGDDLSDLAAHFPTAALAVLTFDAPAWADISVRGGKLVHFTFPRRLSGG